MTLNTSRTPAPASAPPATLAPTTTRRSQRMELLLALLAFVVVNAVSIIDVQRWDWTDTGQHTLSDATLSTLRRIETPTTVYAFFSRDQQDYIELRALLEQYDVASDNVQVRFIDPDREASVYRGLQGRLGLTDLPSRDFTIARYPVVVEQGNQHAKVERHDLTQQSLDADDEQLLLVSTSSERAITGALIQVTEGRTHTLCITLAFGARSIAGTADTEPLTAFADELRWEGIDVQERGTDGVFEVTSQGAAECDAVWLVATTEVVPPSFVESLTEYVNNGGTFVMLVDPVIRRGEVVPTGLEAFFKNHGIELSTDVVLELSTMDRIGDDPAARVLVRRYGEHESVQSTVGAVLMSLVRRVAATGSNAASLAQTSEMGLAVADLKTINSAEIDPQSLRTTSLGAVSGRVLVIGDSDWLNNDVLRRPEVANVDWLASIANWSVGNKPFTDVPLHTEPMSALLMTPSDLNSLLVRVVVLVPLAFLFLGLGVWWRSRT